MNFWTDLNHYIGMYCNDKIAHFLVGFLLTILLYNLRVRSMKSILLFVLVTAFWKETWDMMTEIQPIEHLLDIGATIAFPTMMLVLARMEEDT
jgi:ABC-type uncharacterized transport system permease subunit